MKSYALISHTGETAIKVEADTLSNLFIAALSGMNQILKKDYDKELNRHAIVHEIVLTSADLTSLLIDFLSEVLTVSDINKVIFYNADLLEINVEENQVHAHLIGAKIDKFTTDIKAVTYHEAEIKKNEKGNYETVVVFDI